MKREKKKIEKNTELKRKKEWKGEISKQRENKRTKKAELQKEWKEAEET